MLTTCCHIRVAVVINQTFQSFMHIITQNEGAEGDTTFHCEVWLKIQILTVPYTLKSDDVEVSEISKEQICLVLSMLDAVKLGE